MGKLPQVTLLFWIMMISATTLGETSGDLLSMTLKLGYAFSSVLLFAFWATSSPTPRGWAMPAAPS